MSRNIDWIKLLVAYTSKTKKFEQHLRDIKFLSLSNGRCKLELTVTNDHLNMQESFHGGLATTLVDVVSSWALLSHGNGFSGVSTNIHISHFQPALVGEIVTIDAKLCRVEEQLAFAEVILAKNNGKQIVAHGQHTLFIKPIDEEYMARVIV